VYVIKNIAAAAAAAAAAAVAPAKAFTAGTADTQVPAAQWLCIARYAWHKLLLHC
jgi:hypothetical protein